MAGSFFKSHNRGATLIEVAIAFAVVGLIMTAVWTAGGAVRNRARIETSVQTITDVADRVRALYRSYPGANSYADTTAKQIAAKLVPDFAIKDNDTTVNEWGGEVHIAFKRVNNWIVGFGVALDMSSTLPVEERNQACADIVMRLQGSGHSSEGFNTSNNVPLPSTYPLPSQDNAPDDGPIYAFAGNGGWTNVTNKGQMEMLSGFGAGGCTNVAFYFKL